MCLSPRVLFLAVCPLLTASLLAAAKSHHASAPERRATLPVPMPVVYSGVPYDRKIAGNLGLAYGDLTCPDPPSPALPSGLTFHCAPTLGITGTASIDKDAEVRSQIKVVDSLGKSVVFELNFFVRPAKGTVVVGGKEPPPAKPPTTPPPPDYTKLKFVPTTPITEQASTIAGYIKPPLGGFASKLSIRVWLAPEAGHEEKDRKLADLKPPSGTCCVTLVHQVPLVDDGSYLINFISPLASGQFVTLSLVDKDDEVKTDKPVLLSSTIPLKHLNLDVTSEVTAGSTTIGGKVDMPLPAYPPNATATPPLVGNYPQIAVWMRDADLGLWAQAALVNADGSTTSPTQTVQDKGNFTVTLKQPLKNGQEVRVDAIPPFGRRFMPMEDPPRPPGHEENDCSIYTRVVSTLALVQPSVSTILTEGTVTLTGIATTPTAGAVSVAVLRVDPVIEVELKPGAFADGVVGDPYRRTDVCITADQLDRYFSKEGWSREGDNLIKHGRLLSLISSGSNVLLAPVDQSGGFKLTLAEALKEDDRIQIVQILPAGTLLGKPQYDRCASPVQKVRYAFDWHRTNINFVAGVLISNSSPTSSSANFSQANQFYAFNLDRAWREPGADCVGGSQNDFKKIKETGKRPAKKDLKGFAYGREEYGHCRGSGWHAYKWPGINTYFEGRLTSIPVSTAASNPSPNVTSTTKTTSAATLTPADTTTTTTTPATTQTSSLLTSQKVFRVSTGLFFPWVFGHGPGRHPNGIFFAPLAKAGFDTVTGAGTASNVILPGGTTGTLSYQTAYNFFAFGGRLGNMELSASHDRAPKIDHYFDVTIGRYSNLQSYVCHNLKAKQAPLQMTTGSTCIADYPQYFTAPAATSSAGPVVESRKQLYRLDFEGLVKIPVPATAIPFYIGFNANIAQHTVGAESLDHGYAPPDDIRILFGTRIDMGALLSTLKLGAN